MYFANMFCFGSDQAIVGITGIRGCMGMVYAGAQALYAIHIPPDVKDVVMEAGRAFALFVRSNEGAMGPPNHLFGFVNGTNRPVHGGMLSGEEELAIVKKSLGSPPTQLYRIMSHLGANSGGSQADAVVIMVERVHASDYYPSGCANYYKRNDDINWIAGGQAFRGQYSPKLAFQNAEVPSDVLAGWRRASKDNCTITSI